MILQVRRYKIELRLEEVVGSAPLRGLDLVVSHRLPGPSVINTPLFNGADTRKQQPFIVRGWSFAEEINPS